MIAVIATITKKWLPHDRNSCWTFFPVIATIVARDGGAGGAGGALVSPLLRRMTFYFVLVCGTYKEIKKNENKETKEFSSGYSPKE